MADTDTTSSATSDKLLITTDRLRAWSACSDGYRWFIGRFPQGGAFADVYAALIEARRTSDSVWLVDHVFAELDTEQRVQQTIGIAGADAAKIRVLANGGDLAATTGEGANAATTGDWANAATTGAWANAATTGERANAATTGEGANAATTGYRANAATTGEGANAATTGYRANAATTGDWANAATTGYGANAATTGKGAIAAALGQHGRAKADVGGAIVIAARDSAGALLHVFASLVGQNGIEPNTWYRLDASGVPVACADTEAA